MVPWIDGNLDGRVSYETGCQLPSRRRSCPSGPLPLSVHRMHAAARVTICPHVPRAQLAEQPLVVRACPPVRQALFASVANKRRNISASRTRTSQRPVRTGPCRLLVRACSAHSTPASSSTPKTSCHAASQTGWWSVSRASSEILRQDDAALGTSILHGGDEARLHAILPHRARFPPA